VFYSFFFFYVSLFSFRLGKELFASALSLIAVVVVVSAVVDGDDVVRSLRSFFVLPLRQQMTKNGKHNATTLTTIVSGEFLYCFFTYLKDASKYVLK